MNCAALIETYEKQFRDLCAKGSLIIHENGILDTASDLLLSSTEALGLVAPPPVPNDTDDWVIIDEFTASDTSLKDYSFSSSHRDNNTCARSGRRGI